MGVRRSVAAVATLAALAAGCSAETAGSGSSPPGDGRTTAPAEPGSEAGVVPPAFADLVPTRTRQVVRTVSSDRWCPRVHCAITQAWARRGDTWHLVREFRSSISPGGWGKEKQDDLGTPEGVFRIAVTFSTTAESPGLMPWRRRLPTSNVTDEAGRRYNTWIEEPWRTDGDRPSMRWGFVVDYNNVRLTPGVGPAPVAGAGSGIFYHTSRPGHRWEPSEGCTRVGDPADMRWLLSWLRPEADPRVVQNR
jgi:L,D-peptidoglycan transpeptidase YkuD (ErfK/YbiS/YcfS/YnhG family)